MGAIMFPDMIDMREFGAEAAEIIQTRREWLDLRG